MALFVHPLDVSGQFDPVDDDRSELMLLQPIDETDQRRFAGAGWTTDDDALAAADREVDIAQRVKVSVPLVDADEIDGDCVFGTCVGEGALKRHLLRPRASTPSTKAE